MQTLAKLALLGVISLSENTQAFSVTRRLGNQEKLYIDLALDESESDSDDEHPKDKANVQTHKVMEDLDNFNGWEAHMDEFPGTVNEHGSWFEPYTRQVPERFEGEAAEVEVPVDKFTQNMIKNYAIEAVDKDEYKKRDPQRTHRFYITKDAAKKVGYEILATHFGKQGADADKYMSWKFEEAWNHYDVLHEDRIDAIGSNVFFRYLCRPLGDLDLQ